jgi:hypothetical protein
MTMPRMYVDIETIRDPKNPGKDLEEGRVQAAPHNLIVAACATVLTERVCNDGDGYRWFEATQALVFGRGSVVERDILVHMQDALQRRPLLRGWSTEGFDLPVIRAACMAHGVCISWLFDDAVTSRYKSGHVDLMDELCSRGGAPRWSLDGCARRNGLPGKMDVCGSGVAEMFAAGKHKELQGYCLTDTWQPAAIDMRLELAKGGLTLAGYQKSAMSLVELAEVTPALRQIVEHERFDRAKFLLEVTQ